MRTTFPRPILTCLNKLSFVLLLRLCGSTLGRRTALRRLLTGGHSLASVSRPPRSWASKNLREVALGTEFARENVFGGQIYRRCMYRMAHLPGNALPLARESAWVTGVHQGRVCTQ